MLYEAFLWNQQSYCQRKLRIWLLLTLSHKETPDQLPHPSILPIQLTFSRKWNHLTVCLRNLLPQYLKRRALGRADSSQEQLGPFKAGVSLRLSGGQTLCVLGTLGPLGLANNITGHICACRWRWGWSTRATYCFRESTYRVYHAGCTSPPFEYLKPLLVSSLELREN